MPEFTLVGRLLVVLGICGVLLLVLLLLSLRRVSRELEIFDAGVARGRETTQEEDSSR